MADYLHPADPVYLGLQLSQLRFELDNGRAPTADETLTLVQERFECDRDEAEAIMASVSRTLELEKIARDMLDDVLPNIMGGVFSEMGRRR